MARRKPNEGPSESTGAASRQKKAAPKAARLPKSRPNPETDTKPTLRAGFVLAVDVVEYSRRPTLEQSEIIQDLVRMAHKCQTFTKAKQRNSVISAPAGDGFLLAFMQDPLSPLRCAIELRRSIQRSGRFRVRMAVHIGALDEVESDIADKANVAGEGANNAARALAGCAPNEIVLTQRAVEFIREAPDFAHHFSAIGSITVKHGETLQLYRFSKERDEPDPLAKFMARAKALHDRVLARGGKPASPRIIAHRLKELRIETLAGFAMIPAVLLLHYGVEHSTFGRSLRISGYQNLVGAMRQGSGESPVVFVDIARDFNQTKAEDSPTDLAKLRELILEVARHEPAAIAIDIDFGLHGSFAPGAEPPRYLDEDEVVLKEARRLTDSGIPVFLSVSEHLEFQDQEQLLGPGYADLAVHPLRPDDALNGQVLVIGEMKIGESSIPSLSQSLARAYMGKHKIEPHGDTWALTRFTEFGEAIRPVDSEEALQAAGLEPRIEGSQLLLNLSSLERIRASQFKAVPSPPMLRNGAPARIKGKAVLIGATGYEADTFNMPVTGKEEYGPYFLAMAANTEIEAPLYEFHLWVAYSLATLVGLAVMFASQFGQRRTVAAERQSIGEWQSLVATAAAVGLSMAAGVYLASLGILWTEYLLAAILLAFHPAIHRKARVLLEKWDARNERVA